MNEPSTTPEPLPALRAVTGSEVRCPNCERLTTGGLFGHCNQPKDWQEQKWIVTHCGCYHEPRGGERYTADRDAREYVINGNPSPETAAALHEVVRLADPQNTEASERGL